MPNIFESSGLQSGSESQVLRSFFPSARPNNSWRKKATQLCSGGFRHLVTVMHGLGSPTTNITRKPLAGDDGKGRVAGG